MTRADFRTPFAFGIVVFILGVNFVAVRYSNQELSPFWGAGARFSIAALVLFLLVFGMHLPLPRGRALTGAVLFGVLAFGATYALAYWALLGISAGLLSVLFALIPLATLFFAMAHGLERFRLRGLVGGLVALAGIALIFNQRVGTGPSWAPLLAGLFAALCAAESGVVVKRFPRSHPFATNAVAMAVGAALLFTLSWATHEPHSLPTRRSTVLAIGWLVAAGSVTAFALYVFVLSRWTASATSYQAVLSPLVTFAVAAYLLGERITILFAAATALVLAGVYLGAAASIHPPAPKGTP